MRGEILTLKNQRTEHPKFAPNPYTKGASPDEFDMRKTSGKKPKPGDTVVLVEAPPGLLGSLPIEDQDAISQIVGKPILLREYDDSGRAELEFKDCMGVIHFIYVDPKFLKIAR